MAIKPNELRIGNYILVKSAIGTYLQKQVESITNDGINLAFGINWYDDGESFDRLKPIELTEEWLLKFGFIKGDMGIYKHRSFNHGVQKEFKHIGSRPFVWIMYSGHGCLHIEIETVHHLQNLFFALTGEELVCTSQ